MIVFKLYCTAQFFFMTFRYFAIGDLMRVWLDCSLENVGVLLVILLVCHLYLKPSIKVNNCPCDFPNLKNLANEFSWNSMPDIAEFLWSGPLLPELNTACTFNWMREEMTEVGRDLKLPKMKTKQWMQSQCNRSQRLIFIIFQRGGEGARLQRRDWHEGQLQLEHRQAHPEGAAGLLQQQRPHRPHHQARQLLAETENKSRQPKVQIRGENWF